MVLAAVVMTVSLASYVVWWQSGGVQRASTRLTQLGIEVRQVETALSAAQSDLVTFETLQALAAAPSGDEQQRLEQTVLALQVAAAARQSAQTETSIVQSAIARELSRVRIDQLGAELSRATMQTADLTTVQRLRAQTQRELTTLAAEAKRLAAEIAAERAKKRALLPSTEDQVEPDFKPTGVRLTQLPVNEAAVIALLSDGKDPPLLLPVSGDLRWLDQPFALQVLSPVSTTVLAPGDGLVVFAGPYRSYGNVILLEHQLNKHSLISRLGRLDVQRGDPVLRGEPIASLLGQDAAASSLYYELREGGRPINPRVWFGFPPQQNLSQARPGDSEPAGSAID